MLWAVLLPAALPAAAGSSDPCACEDTATRTLRALQGVPLSAAGVLDRCDAAIERGVRVQIDEDDRVFLGAWTRLMLRRRA